MGLANRLFEGFFGLNKIKDTSYLSGYRQGLREAAKIAKEEADSECNWKKKYVESGDSSFATQAASGEHSALVIYGCIMDLLEKYEVN